MRLEVKNGGLFLDIVVSFNSSLVRLEVFFPNAEKSGKSSFNSSLVRLEVEVTENDLVEFICFNSSLVRLEDNRKNESCQRSRVSIPHWCDWKLLGLSVVGCVPCCFNSSLVRLEEDFGRHSKRAVVRFNSSLVRLEAWIKLGIAAKPWFQFLIGAIGRHVRPVQ